MTDTKIITNKGVFPGNYFFLCIIISVIMRSAQNGSSISIKGPQLELPSACLPMCSTKKIAESWWFRVASQPETKKLHVPSKQKKLIIKNFTRLYLASAHPKQLKLHPNSNTSDKVPTNRLMLQSNQRNLFNLFAIIVFTTPTLVNR